MSREFLLTNQYGGFTSLDLDKGITRKYHGILIAGLYNFERFNIVTALKEQVFEPGKKEVDFSAFSAGKNTAALHSSFLVETLHKPLPVQKFVVGPGKIKKTFSFDEASNFAQIEYEVETTMPMELVISPLINFRDIHNIGLNKYLKDTSQLGLFQHQGQFIVYLSDQWQLNITSDMSFRKQTSHLNVFYPQEKDRGYEAEEELLLAGEFRLSCPNAGKYSAKISFKLTPRSSVMRLWQLTRLQLQGNDNPSIVDDIQYLVERYPQLDESFAEFLATNARKFLVKTKTRQSILAGYHWFGEWGRDTFISFPGLVLATGKYDVAQTILIDWSKYLSVGLLPNMMEGLHYNSLDGVLWYFQALYSYFSDTQDKQTVRQLLPKLEQVLENLVVGSKYGIQVNPKGYLIWTDESKALTWMDAVVENQPVINRSGAAVEIQALWYNALQILEKLAGQVGYRLGNLPLLDQLQYLLESTLWDDFWNPEVGFFVDFLDNRGNKNFELRPNQLALLALPFRPINFNDNNARTLIKSVIEKIEQELLTPFGLRTLSKRAAGYIGTYSGNAYERDRAYHQGSVWPWLVMLYAKAKLNYAEDKAQALNELKAYLSTFWELIRKQELLSVPELFNGDDLKPGGAISQAWSVAAILEVIKEVYGHSGATA